MSDLLLRELTWILPRLACFRMSSSPDCYLMDSYFDPFSLCILVPSVRHLSVKLT